MPVFKNAAANAAGFIGTPPVMPWGPPPPPSIAKRLSSERVLRNDPGPPSTRFGVNVNVSSRSNPISRRKSSSVVILGSGMTGAARVMVSRLKARATVL